MALPCTRPSDSAYRLFYEGAVGVAGFAAEQRWELNLIPDYLREQDSFQDNFLIFAKSPDGGVSKIYPDVEFSSDNSELVLTLDSAAEASTISLEIWYMASSIR